MGRSFLECQQAHLAVAGASGVVDRLGRAPSLRRLAEVMREFSEM